MQLNGKSDGSREKTFFLLLEISKGSYSYYLSKAERVNKDNAVTMTTTICSQVCPASQL